MPQGNQTKEQKSAAQRTLDLLNGRNIAIAGGIGQLASTGVGIAKNMAAKGMVRNAMLAPDPSVARAMGRTAPGIMRGGPVVGLPSPVLPSQIMSAESLRPVPPEIDPVTGQKLGLTNPMRAERTVQAVSDAKSGLKKAARPYINEALRRKYGAPSSVPKQGLGSKISANVTNLRTNLGIGSNVAQPPKPKAAAMTVRGQNVNTNRLRVRAGEFNSRAQDINKRINAATTTKELEALAKEIQGLPNAERLKIFNRELSPNATKVLKAMGKFGNVAGKVMLGAGLAGEMLTRMDAERTADAAPIGSGPVGSAGPEAKKAAQQAADASNKSFDEIAQLWEQVKKDHAQAQANGALGASNAQVWTKEEMKKRARSLSPDVRKMYLTDERFKGIR